VRAILGRGFVPIVMVGLDPAIHVFLCSHIARRGWPACAGHDDGGKALASFSAGQ
jgi:hypothetical protein